MAGDGHHSDAHGTGAAWQADPVWGPAFRWVETLLDGRVVRAERQARWRPAWFLDVECGDEVIPLYWRGDRGLGAPDRSPLRLEGRILQLLEAHDVPVPHVFGFCEDPAGLLIQRVPGSVEFHRAAPAEQEEVAEDFLRVLARWHRLDVGELVAAGLHRPTGAASHALESVARWERPYRAAETVPAPLIELALWWLHGNPPEGPTPTVLVHGDTGPGQFLFDGGKVSAVLDWEFSHLGDPMEDLALVRGRDLSYPFGDLRRRFRRYQELSGNPVDPVRLRYYSVLAMLITPVGLYPVLTTRPRGADYAQVLAWNAVYSRALVQCLADATGVRLHPVELPDAPPGLRGWIHDAVVDALRGPLVGRLDGFGRYQLESVALLADHLRLADRLGAAFDDAELDDAAELLGFRPRSRAETDEAVQAVVRSDAARRFPDLLRFLHRRCVRDEALLTPLLGELAVTSELRPVD